MTLKEIEEIAKSNKKDAERKAVESLRKYIFDLIADCEETYKNNKDLYTCLADCLCHRLIEDDIAYSDTVEEVYIVRKIKKIFNVKSKNWRDFATV